MKSIIFAFVFLIFVSSICFSQTDSLLMDWKTKEDFQKSEVNVQKFILWLEYNSPASDTALRKSVSSYVLAWLVGCPYVSISIDGNFTLIKTNYKYEPQMLAAYMFGIGYYLIEHKDEKQDVKAIYRGIIGMLNLYETILKVEPDMTNNMLDKYKKLESKGELKKYIEDKL